MHPLISILITLAGLGIVILLAGWGVRAGKLSGEMARKSVHVGMGLLCLPFPWIFDSVLAVQILAGIAVLSLLAVRITKLRQSLGSALFSVKRLSIGELLFPVAVAWLFTLGWDRPLLYGISLLLLTLADTAGALIGTKFGKKLYHTTSATKSHIGSIAFFVTACLCISLPLYLYSDLAPLSILFLTLTISLFTMALEGASGHGLDNLLIPIAAFLLLDYYIELPGSAMFWRSFILLTLLALLMATQRKHSFNGGALLTAMLYGFSAFTLGGVPCLLAALLIFINHIIAQHNMPKDYIVTHSVEVIAAIAIPSLLWLTLGHGGVISHTTAQFGFIATLSIIIYMLHTGTQQHLQKKSPSLVVGFVLALLTLSPALMLDVPLTRFIPPLIVGLPVAWFYFYWKNGPVSLHWVKLSVLATAASIFIMIL